MTYFFAAMIIVVNFWPLMCSEQSNTNVTSCPWLPRCIFPDWSLNNAKKKRMHCHFSLYLFHLDRQITSPIETAITAILRTITLYNKITNILPHSYIIVHDHETQIVNTLQILLIVFCMIPGVNIKRYMVWTQWLRLCFDYFTFKSTFYKNPCKKKKQAALCLPLFKTKSEVLSNLNPNKMKWKTDPCSKSLHPVKYFLR